MRFYSVQIPIHIEKFLKELVLELEIQGNRVNCSSSDVTGNVCIVQRFRARGLLEV